MTPKSNDYKIASGWLVLAAALILPLAIGVILGAGFGWLTLAILLILGAVRFGNLAKAQETKEKKDEQPTTEPTTEPTTQPSSLGE